LAENPRLGKDWFRLLNDPDPLELRRMIRVGESVAWPKLHMIENRAKVEKQILYGRQYIRRVLRGRVALPQSRSMLLRRPNSPVPSFDPRIPPLAPSPPQSSSEQPMSVDTDAEAAFSRGSRWFFKRGHAHASPSPASGASTPNGGPIQDPLRSPTIRRKWTSELLSPTLNGHNSESDPSYPQSNPRQGSRHSDTFLSRLRARSFPNLTSPFSGDMKRLSRESTDIAEHAWSSDSSSEDDLHVENRRQMRHPSAMSSGALEL